eukprot:scaffold25417_cov22-Tisochrysis_lutea.AAC.1
MLPPVQKKHSSGDHNTSSIRRGSKQRTGTSLDKPGEHTHTSHWESGVMLRCTSSSLFFM